MALSLQQGVALVGDTTFQNRVAMAFYFVANEVIEEVTTVAGHENRERFARSIIGQPVSAFLPYAALVVIDPVIRGGSATPASPPTDAQILDAVRGKWNRLANVEA